MVAGSRLSISTVSNAPFAPALCSADAMNQFVEYSLSPPRGPDCWMSETNAVPMNMAFQFPNCVISMGMGDDAGFADVPEARPIEIHARILSARLYRHGASGDTPRNAKTRCFCSRSIMLSSRRLTAGSRTAEPRLRERLQMRRRTEERSTNPGGDGAGGAC